MSGPNPFKNPFKRMQYVKLSNPAVDCANAALDTAKGTSVADAERSFMGALGDRRIRDLVSSEWYWESDVARVLADVFRIILEKLPPNEIYGFLNRSICEPALVACARYSNDTNGSIARALLFLSHRYQSNSEDFPSELRLNIFTLLEQRGFLSKVFEPNVAAHYVATFYAYTFEGAPEYVAFALLHPSSAFQKMKADKNFASNLRELKAEYLLKALV